MVQGLHRTPRRKEEDNHIPAFGRCSEKLEAAGYPTANERVDEVLRRHGAKS